MFHSTCKSWMFYGETCVGVILYRMVRCQPISNTYKKFFHYYEILQLRKIADFMLSLFHRRDPITPI
jgi:hypothetical protein